jgi:serine/threonine protein phosphatase PrpC
MLSGILETELSGAHSIQAALINAYAKVSKEILKSEIDIKFSGSTCVGVLFKNQTIYSANVGDSRAVMCYTKNGSNKTQ